MAELINERVYAQANGDVVVFPIGMRINRLWKLWKWLPVLQAMPKMLAELGAQPDLAPPGRRETIYVDMPSFWRGQSAKLYPAKGSRDSAAKRLAAYQPVPTQGDDT